MIVVCLCSEGGKFQILLAPRFNFNSDGCNHCLWSIVWVVSPWDRRHVEMYLGKSSMVVSISVKYLPKSAITNLSQTDIITTTTLVSLAHKVKNCKFKHIKHLRIMLSVTRWLNYFFNLWSFRTMKICAKV